jgi:uncharacterized membrane protein
VDFSRILETFESLSVLFLVLYFFGLIISAIFIYLGVKLTRLKNSSAKKSLPAAFYSTLIIYLTIAFFLVIPSIPTLIGFILGLFLAFYPILRIFHTKLEKILIIWIFACFGQLAAATLGTSLFVGKFKDLLKIL